ncbi:hypothetical protein CEE45_10610 [Candidatus Heimdallarchaeota archaeon B3_Heim]|nr:MAG: hypothetical protein CEE45_10610 [Candidatus Heimdallarchaeota archaeon B3_Heim]
MGKESLLSIPKKWKLNFPTVRRIILMGWDERISNHRCIWLVFFSHNEIMLKYKKMGNLIRRGREKVKENAAKNSENIKKLILERKEELISEEVKKGIITKMEIGIA